jgi:oligopeptide transport system substrate-binding protein
MTYELPNPKIDAYRKQYPNPSASIRTSEFISIAAMSSGPRLTTNAYARRSRLRSTRSHREEHHAGRPEAGLFGQLPGNRRLFSKAKLEGTIEDAKRLLAEAGFPDGKGFQPSNCSTTRPKIIVRSPKRFSKCGARTSALISPC